MMMMIVMMIMSCLLFDMSIKTVKSRMKATKIPVIIRAIGLIKKGWRNISNKSRVTSTYTNYRSDYNN